MFKIAALAILVFCQNPRGQTMKFDFYANNDLQCKDILSF